MPPLPLKRNSRPRKIAIFGLIRFTGVQAQIDCPGPLRRIVVWDADNEREIVLLTNLLDFGATTIAAIYKERWQIELFFKALKQNLTVKTFVGTSENALRIQIWTALIALLLLKWLHHLSKANWSLSNLASMLRLNLFTYRELTKWLHDPMQTPPLVPPLEQLTLALG
jgi:IS4 transposase